MRSSTAASWYDLGLQPLSSCVCLLHCPRKAVAQCLRCRCRQLRSYPEFTVKSHRASTAFCDSCVSRLLQITVFSAPNYCDEMGNKGAFIRYAYARAFPFGASFPSCIVLGGS